MISNVFSNLCSNMSRAGWALPCEERFAAPGFIKFLSWMGVVRKRAFYWFIVVHVHEKFEDLTPHSSLILIRSRATKRAHSTSIANLNLNRPEKPQSFRPPSIPAPTNQPWVVFTPTERAYQPQQSHTPELLLRGSRPPPSKSLTRSASLRRRVLPHRKSVSSSEIRTELRKSRWLLVCISTNSSGALGLTFECDADISCRR